MKTISDYTIYCTPEQTKKALELGANIIKVEEDFNAVPTCYVDKSNDLYEIPTAEQMIGFLEEQNGIKEISVYCDVTGKTWYFDMYGYEGNSLITIKEISNSYSFLSRKEATLAAIGAALEYLLNKKK